ncbi:MAG: hypothetical protein ACOC00_07425 [Halothiobacillaceae bacterium]
MAVTERSTLLLELPGIPRRPGKPGDDAYADWQTWLEGHEPCADFGAVMARVRAGLRTVLDERALADDPAARARIEGLASAALLFDGLMNARRDLNAGRAPLLPAAELERFLVTEDQIRSGTVDFAWRRFVEAYAQRIFALLQAAAPLGRGWGGGLPRRLAIVLLERHVNTLKKQPEAAFADQPPRLGVADWPPLAWRVLRTG